MDYKSQIKTLKNLEAIAYGYNINGEVLGMDCSDFEQIMVDAAESITDLLSRAEEAEARAEKAEREKGAAIHDVFEAASAKCFWCKHQDHKWLSDGKMDDLCYTCLKNNKCNWEWRGQKEE